VQTAAISFEYGDFASTSRIFLSVDFSTDGILIVTRCTKSQFCSAVLLDSVIVRVVK
jgi:hypothetical protein